jgi:hypothetical protein
VVGALATGFSGIEGLFDLSGPDVHKLENILTLQLMHHHEFYAMRLWFEEDPVRRDPLFHLGFTI